MTRHVLLYKITGCMGDVLAQLNAEGKTLDERSIRIFCDRFTQAYLALPAPRVTELAKAVHGDERQHGGLLSRGTVALADVVLSEGRVR